MNDRVLVDFHLQIKKKEMFDSIFYSIDRDREKEKELPLDDDEDWSNESQFSLT